MPAETIRELAHAYAKADKAQLCWTLGITEHHNAVDNVLSLINLALLTGHVGPRGQRAVTSPRPEQRAGRRRHGSHPEQAPRLPGRRRRRGRAGAFRRRLRRNHPSPVRQAPLRDVRGDGARRRCGRSTSWARTQPRARPTCSTPATCSSRSTCWSCRTSSSRRPLSSQTSCCPRRPRGARPRAR